MALNNKDRMRTEELIEEIEELCQLLKGDDVPVTQWLDSLGESMRATDLITELEFADEKEKQNVHMPILPQLFHLLRECLLKHRWSEALQVLQKVIHVPIGTSRTIWKVGTELLSMDGESNRDLIEQLFSQMRVLSDLNTKEVVIEFVVYLLRIGENTEAATVMQEAKKRQGRKKEGSNKCKEYIDKLHKAYLGLLWYIEWSKCRKCHEQLEADLAAMDDGESFSQNPLLSQMQSLTMQITNFHDKAVSCFSELEGYPGIWDIFVTKHAELLIQSNESADAASLLKRYCDDNPDSLNAHKYLYTFTKKHFPDHHAQIQQLETIAKLSPSDELVLQLCSMLLEGDTCTAIQYLFNLLDYSCWQNKEAPWKMMAECLNIVYKDRYEDFNVKIIGEYWGKRKSWWPSYHFTKYIAKNGSEHSLKYHKAVVASLLCEQGLYKVQKMLRSQFQKHLWFLYMPAQCIAPIHDTSVYSPNFMNKTSLLVNSTQVSLAACFTIL